MREFIKAIIDNGGTVKYPYKESLEKWMSEASISVIEPGIIDKKERMYCVRWPSGWEQLKSMNEALNLFMGLVFSKNNLGLAINGIRRHKLTKKILDDLSEDEMKRLVNHYREQHFDDDYPFA